MKTSSLTPYALLGHPVGHSLSPVMHNTAFKALKLPGDYSLLDVQPGDVPRVIEELQHLGFGGVNVTIPHKEAAYRFLAARHALSNSAQILKSVNTIVFNKDGSLLGHNTDAPGFLDAMKEAFQATPRGKKILLLGCGGAGRAVALTCAFQGAASFLIADLHPAARRRLRSELRHAAPGLPVSGIALTSKQLVAKARECDLIIHATPVGMKKGDPSLLPAEAFRPGQLVFDCIYNPAVTPLLATAKKTGAQTANGLGMLLHQGARAFRLWTGRKPPVDLMRTALEKALKERTG